MESDEGKVFVGGISFETDEEKLRNHFSGYGGVADVVVMREKLTGRPRGFAFVVLSDPSALSSVLGDSHVIDGRTVEVKQARSRGEHPPSARSANPVTWKNTAVRTGEVKTKKIFVGGLPSTLTEEGFRQYFEAYGSVTDAVIMFDQSTQRPRGFGFISFDSEGSVDSVLHKTFHELDGKLVEVKKALPRDANPSTRSAGGFSSSQPFGGATPNTGSYDVKAEGNRYQQQQFTGSYPSYGLPGYGYGTPGGAIGYGGYGMGGGYGGIGAGYGGPSGSYGNPSAAGYMGGPPGAPRSPWTNQLPSGYGPGGYGGNSGYGAAGWSGPTTGGGNFAPGIRLPSGISYGGQGYGYGGYGVCDGQYQGGYGAVGGPGGAQHGNVGSGTDQRVTPSYSSGGFGDASGAPTCTNTWSAETAKGGYAASQADGAPGGPSSYGSSQIRLPQQQ